MKLIKTIMLSACMPLLAAAAHAGDNNPSLFSCGLRLGDTPAVEKTYSARKPVKGYDVARPVVELRAPSEFGAASFTATATTSNFRERKRTPSEFTVARFVCSW